METSQEIIDFINTAKKNSIKEYAKTLLDSFDYCQDIDPVLIEELWAPEVYNFLNMLKNI